MTIGRVWIRSAIVKSLRWDDAAHLLGLAFLLAQVAIVSGASSLMYERTEYGSVLNDEKERQLFLRLDITGIVVTWCCLYAIKASFLLLYRHIFQISKGFSRAWWITSAVVFATFWVLFAGSLTQCGSASALSNISTLFSRCAVHRII